MFRELKEHKLAYIILILALIIGLVLFLGAWPDRRLQRLVAGSIALFYFFWGIITHFKSKKLTNRIFFEYLAVSLVAGFLMVLVTL